MWRRGGKSKDDMGFPWNQSDPNSIPWIGSSTTQEFPLLGPYSGNPSFLPQPSGIHSSSIRYGSQPHLSNHTGIYDQAATTEFLQSIQQLKPSSMDHGPVAAGRFLPSQMPSESIACSNHRQLPPAMQIGNMGTPMLISNPDCTVSMQQTLNGIHTVHNAGHQSVVENRRGGMIMDSNRVHSEPIAYNQPSSLNFGSCNLNDICDTNSLPGQHFSLDNSFDMDFMRELGLTLNNNQDGGVETVSNGFDLTAQYNDSGGANVFQMVMDDRRLLDELDSILRPLTCRADPPQFQLQQQHQAAATVMVGSGSGQWEAIERNSRSAPPSPGPSRRKRSHSTCQPWSEMAQEDQTKIVENLATIVNTHMDIFEQLEIIRILDPDAKLAFSTKEFRVELDMLDDEKFRHIRDLLRLQGISLTSNKLAGCGSTAAIDLSNVDNQSRKLTKQELRLSRQQRLMKLRHRKDRLQYARERKSGLFSLNQTFSLKPCLSEEDAEIDIIS